MARGDYAPLDRDRHWVTSWGVDHATSYARDRATERVLRPLVPALEVASQIQRGTRGARHAWKASREIGGRGSVEEPLSIVGAEWWHSVADRQRAITQLASGFQALALDLVAWHAAHPDTASTGAVVQWFSADVTPTLDEWHEFAARESGSWWVRAATDWEAFEDWYDRLKRLRELARAHGIALTSDEPPRLPQTVWKRSADGKGGEAMAWLGVLKIAVVAAIGVTGAITLYSSLRELRGKGKTT